MATDPFGSGTTYDDSSAATVGRAAAQGRTAMTGGLSGIGGTAPGQAAAAGRDGGQSASNPAGGNPSGPPGGGGYQGGGDAGSRSRDPIGGTRLSSGRVGGGMTVSQQLQAMRGINQNVVQNNQGMPRQSMQVNAAAKGNMINSGAPRQASLVNVGAPLTRGVPISARPFTETNPQITGVQPGLSAPPVQRPSFPGRPAPPAQFTSRVAGRPSDLDPAAIEVGGFQTGAGIQVAGAHGQNFARAPYAGRGVMAPRIAPASGVIQQNNQGQPGPVVNRAARANRLPGLPGRPAPSPVASRPGTDVPGRPAPAARPPGQRPPQGGGKPPAKVAQGGGKAPSRTPSKSGGRPSGQNAGGKAKEIIKKVAAKKRGGKTARYAEGGAVERFLAKYPDFQVEAA